MLTDGTILHSDRASWLNYALKTTARHDGRSKTVYASGPSVKSLRVVHHGLEKTIESAPDMQVFQSISARTTFTQDKDTQEIIGRVIGIIKEGVVTEEYFLNGELNEIIGFKYNV